VNLAEPVPPFAGTGWGDRHIRDAAPRLDADGQSVKPECLRWMETRPSCSYRRPPDKM
jgi:hypothetical protein